MSLYKLSQRFIQDHSVEIPYSLKFSRIKYFVVWLNSAQKQIFADKIFVVERESRKVHTYNIIKY